MVKHSSTLDPNRNTRFPKTAGEWIVTCLLGLPVAVLFLTALAALTNGISYILYLASEAPTFDTWGVLSIVSALMSLIAVVGTGLAVSRARMVSALFFAALSLPASFVLEGSRCDTSYSCHMMSWAALPPSVLDWQVRIRPVTDLNEAYAIAFDAISKTKRKDSPFQAKRFGDHWIVSTIDADGRPGAHAVRIDTRSGRTALTPCPQDRIRCGMERPTVSDGQRIYQDENAGLRAVFPASRSVCTARTDDGEARGFYAMVRDPDMPCEILDQSRQMGVELVQSRRAGCASPEMKSMPWRPLSADTAKLFKSPTPTLGGLPSLACELREGDQIQISVYASTRRGSEPVTTYEAYIVTTPSYLAEDIRAFELFLENARLGSAVRG